MSESAGGTSKQAFTKRRTEAMLTDVQIAQSAQMQPIKEIAAKVGLVEDDLELYGKYKAKISLEAISKVKDNKDGKLVLVTAINPTPAG